jgi:hypothetical protein
VGSVFNFTTKAAGHEGQMSNSSAEAKSLENSGTFGRSQASIILERQEKPNIKGGNNHVESKDVL